MVGQVVASEPMAVTIEEAAKLLCIGRSLAYQLAESGELPTIRIGQRRLVVPYDRLKAMVSGNGERPDGHGQPPAA